MTQRTSQPARVIRSSILSAFTELMQSLGYDVAPLIRRVRLDPGLLEDSDLILTMRQLNELLEVTANETGVTDLGLRLAIARGIPDFGLVTLLLREQPSLEAVLETLISHIHLHSNASYMRVETIGAGPALVLDILLDPKAARRQSIETSVGSIVQLLRSLLGQHWTPAAVWFAHGKPDSVELHQQYFRADVEFGQQVNAILFRASDFDQILQQASRGAVRALERHVLGLATADDSHSQRVAHIIRRTLPRGDAKATVVAAHLGTNARTLNRWLAKEGMNFCTILEETRRSLVFDYLMEPDHTLSGIARMMGFYSLSAFSTWFHGTFGESPSHWRKAAFESHRVEAPL
ncbi:MAG: AraC family transcriptional regulator [Sphingobium sp.]